MKEKDFKALITTFDEYSNTKKQNDAFIDTLFTKLNTQDFQISDYKYANWALFQVYDELDISLFIDLTTSKINNNNYYDRYLKNALENQLIEQNVDELKRQASTISFCYINKEVTLNIIDFTQVADLQKEINELSNRYSLLLNTFKIIKALINQEQIKAIDPIILFKLYQANIASLNDNKYYAHLEILIKAIDEIFNNKKYAIAYFGKEMLLSDLISEANIGEYKRLRKALATAVKVEEDEVKFDSAREVIIDVNPQKAGDIYMWHYALVGRNIENSGGEYQNNLADYQTAILKGIFKGLKKITEMPSLVNKLIVLKCEYSGILTDVMLTNDENKSRMKTIKQLIETNNLKVTTTI